MSKAERRSDEIRETTFAVAEHAEWRCERVHPDGRRCYESGNQCAHVLPQDELHIARYGLAVIHARVNLRWVCGLECNQAVEIDYRSRPIEADAYAQRVREWLEGIPWD